MTAAVHERLPSQAVIAAASDTRQQRPSCPDGQLTDGVVYAVRELGTVYLGADLFVPYNALRTALLGRHHAVGDLGQLQSAQFSYWSKKASSPGGSGLYMGPGRECRAAYCARYTFRFGATWPPDLVVRDRTAKSRY